MTTKFYSYQPTKGHGLPHDPIPSLIGPRPIGWISTCDSQGRTNLAPYSFFNIFNYSPPFWPFPAWVKKTLSPMPSKQGNLSITLRH